MKLKKTRKSRNESILKGMKESCRERVED